MNKRIYKSIFASALALMLVLCFSFNAFAYAEDQSQQITINTGSQVTPVVTPSPTPTPTPTPTPSPTVSGDGFSNDGNAQTRDLLYDKATNKQFISVETKDGSVFYIVIDYDAPINEDEELYQTYFLNLVDDRDLIDLLGEEDAAAETCGCLIKCEAGNVNTLCEVCKSTMSECVGVQAEPNENDGEEIPEEPAGDEDGISMFTIIVVIAAVVLAVYYFKFIKNKDGDGAASDFFEDEEYNESEYINEDET